MIRRSGENASLEIQRDAKRAEAGQVVRYRTDNQAKRCYSLGDER
jgi:hypothetical protein